MALVAAQFAFIFVLASPVRTLVPRTAVGALGALLIVASLALVAWAVVAMRPANFSVGRGRIAALAASHGLACLPSSTNFVTVDFGGAARARATLDGLLGRGVFVRKPAAPPLDRCVRFGIGTPAELEVLERALADVEAERRISSA